MTYVYVFNISWSETKNIYAHETDIMVFSIRNLILTTSRLTQLPHIDT